MTVLAYLVELKRDLSIFYVKIFFTRLKIAEQNLLTSLTRYKRKVAIIMSQSKIKSLLPFQFWICPSSWFIIRNSNYFVYYFRTLSNTENKLKNAF